MKTSAYKDVTMAFGKFKGELIGSVATNHPDYLLWLADKISSDVEEKTVSEEQLKFQIAVQRYVAENRDILIDIYIGDQPFPLKRFKGKTFDELMNLRDKKALDYRDWIHTQTVTGKIFATPPDKPMYEFKNALIRDYIIRHFV
jgi:hypothetical protein